MKESLSIRSALAQESVKLKKAEIDSPTLDASLLLAHVLNTTRSALIAQGEKPLCEEALMAFNSLIKRRLDGECVAYIVGRKEFRGFDFAVNKSVLVPRPDTETLVETAIEKLAEMIKHRAKESEPNISVLDLCTGSGAVAISLKNEVPQIEVCACDICEKALETAKSNADLLLPNSNIQFYLGDLFNAICANGFPLPTGFSLIISNPPYIPSDEIKTLAIEVQNEPRIALDGGPSGLEIIKRIIDKAPEYLKNGGMLLMEADPRQMDNIKNLLEKKGFNGLQLYNDLSGAQRVIVGAYEK
ncbi:MAG: peptide chain release factor N(5)-glutamine methyltransferase [Treponema sp.]|jgi:release factor glutamine methyltransferase|nr:peptide chain release factor N(5)-glutamine methyltransferase [Treponema sp.]